MQCRVCTRYFAPGPVCAYFPCVVCARATLARPSAVRGPVLFPPCAPAPPVRHRRRPAGAARRPRLRPAARRQVGVAARVAAAQRTVAPTGSWPGGRLLHGRLPRRRVNGVRGGGGGGLGCDGGHLRSCMPEVSVDILTQAAPPAPAKLPLRRAAAPRQRGPGAHRRRDASGARQPGRRLPDPDNLLRSRSIESVETGAFGRASGSGRRLPGQGNRANERQARAKPLALLRSPDCPGSKACHR